MLLKTSLNSSSNRINCTKYEPSGKMVETTSTICRICLQEIMKDAPYQFLNNKNDLMLQSKLLDFLPELDLNITQNPITCSQCTRTINEIHQFKQLCLQTENLLKRQEPSFNDALHIIKKEELDETIKEEFVEDPIKNELQTVDQYLQFNTDVPVCIEETATTKASLYYCYTCNYCTDKKNDLIKHVTNHRSEIPLLKSHDDQYDNKQKIHSNKCNCLNTQEELLKKLAEEKPYCCDMCNYRAKNRSSLQRHSRIHTGEKPFCCNICNYQTVHKGNLKMHLRIHTGEKPFCCDICDYQTAHKTHLKRHLCTHTKEKPFGCNVCDYQTSHKDYLRIHLSIHTGEKPYCCNKCDYQTPHKTYLRKHLRIHTKEKQFFFCNKCDYRTNAMSVLKRHTLTHTGEKPFCCNVCDYQTAHKANLKVHSRIHTGEKPFRCDKCDYRTNLMSRLKRHTFTHSGEKPFSCNICNYQTAYKDCLKKHLCNHTVEKC